MSKRKRATTTKKATLKASTRTQGSRPARGSRYVANYMAPTVCGVLYVTADTHEDATAQVRQRYPDALTITVSLA